MLANPFHYHHAVLAVVLSITLAGCSTGGPGYQPEGTSQPPTDSPGAQPTTICKTSSAAVTIPTKNVFKNGEWVRDFYSGERAQVVDGQVTMAPGKTADGLMLLESADAPTGSFKWAGATVYFAVTDRFANGKTSNDNAYGRQPDGDKEIGTFHGGDFAGLTKKLDYLESLGVNALWITPPVEQVHGWVGGGDRGDFRHYAYHGYWALDFTRPDASYGTEEEFARLVDEAHERDIRVVMDVVMNHPGYSTLQDMQTFNFGALFEGFEQYLPEKWGQWEPKPHENFHAYNALIDFDSPKWSNWWGKDWVRAGLGDYDRPPNAGIDPIRGSLAFLPDFKTESEKAVDLPVFLAKKKNTHAKNLPDATVRDYLVTWLTDWVRRYGIDGFRVDTAKHVEKDAWKELKENAQQALDDYRRKHPDSALPAKNFWMVGEVFPHSVTRDSYFDAGFDAVINFDLQKEAREGAACLPAMEPIYSRYAEKMHGEEPFNVMSYISSHDTRLFSSIADNAPELEKRAAAALLLTPGTVQIFYGDESGRKAGPSGSDRDQGTRSDMNWSAIESGKKDTIVNYWRMLGQFRERHPAIGAGKHHKLNDAPYTFSRTTANDRAIVVFVKDK